MANTTSPYTYLLKKLNLQWADTPTLVTKLAELPDAELINASEELLRECKSDQTYFLLTQALLQNLKSKNQ